MEVTTYEGTFGLWKEGRKYHMNTCRATRVQYVYFRKYVVLSYLEGTTLYFRSKIDTRTFESRATKIFPYFHKVVRLRTCTVRLYDCTCTQYTLHSYTILDVYTYTYCTCSRVLCVYCTCTVRVSDTKRLSIKNPSGLRVNMYEGTKVRRYVI